MTYLAILIKITKSVNKLLIPALAGLLAREMTLAYHAHYTSLDIDTEMFCVRKGIFTQ